MNVNEFETAINKKIVGVLKQGSCSIRELIKKCEGAYPTSVLKCIEEIKDKTLKVNSGPILSLLNNPDNTESKVCITESVQNNPILASWFFTENTCSKIGKLLDWDNKRLAFLGTPRLFEWFINSDLGISRSLFELDKQVISCLSDLVLSNDKSELIACNIFDQLPNKFKGSFDVVFFDPPWYLKYYYVWLQKAIELTPHGVIIFPIFKELTRPSAANERIELVNFLNKSFNEVTFISSYIEYDIPTFEKAELSLIGLKDIGTWKLADLIICKKPIKNFVSFTPSKTPDKFQKVNNWKEVLLNNTRIFIDISRVDQKAIDAPLINSISGSSILKSPSRRDPALLKANIMTSRGHGLFTTKPKYLFEALDRIAGPKSIVGNDLIEKLGFDDNSTLILKKMILFEEQ